MAIWDSDAGVLWRDQVRKWVRRSVIEIAFQNKCSDRSMEVKLAALLENYDRQTDQPTNRTDRLGQKEIYYQQIESL